MDRREFLRAAAVAGVAGTGLAFLPRLGDTEGTAEVLESAALTRVTECGIHSCKGGFENNPPNVPSWCTVETCSGGFTCSTGPSGGGHACMDSHTCSSGHSCTVYDPGCGGSFTGPQAMNGVPMDSEPAVVARRDLVAILDALAKSGRA